MECVQGEPGLAMVPSLPVQLHRVTGISIHLALGVAKDQSSYLHNLTPKLSASVSPMESVEGVVTYGH